MLMNEGRKLGIMNKSLFSIVSYRLIISVALLVGIGLVFLSLSVPESNFKLKRSGTVTKEKQIEHAKLSSSLVVQKGYSPNMSKQESFWKAADFLAKEIPANIKDAADKIEIVNKHVKIMEVDTFYREAIPPPDVVTGQTVLLLHGMAFKSQTWLELKTINILASMGHQVIAVDLPGYGETKDSLQNSRDSYLKDLINALNINNVVIVSPSMSGSFTIPFLLKFSSLISGYVPVAPINTEILSGHGEKIMTPTLVIYGELDTSLGYTSRDNLSILPNSQAVELPNSRHPAYLDQPDMFHKLLYNFLLALKGRS